MMHSILIHIQHIVTEELNSSLGYKEKPLALVLALVFLHLVLVLVLVCHCMGMQGMLDKMFLLDHKHMLLQPRYCN
jgi:hypothetical protein